MSFTWQQKKVLFLSSLGGVLEFYDFIIYIFLAPYIEKFFFANQSQFVATLKTLAIFSIGYLLRPLGGLFFSHFGDRYGRKTVFLITIILMAFPAFGIGLLPGPEQIGILSPILLLLFRVMQGLALGGEIPAAITFVSEHIGKNKHGLSLAVLFFGINSGLLLGSLVTTIVIWVFSMQAMLAYGWRFPFLLGGFFGILSIYLRRYLQETAAFAALRQEAVQRVPVITLIQHSSKQIFLGMMMVATGAVTVFFYLYWPQYLSQYLTYDFSQLMRLNTLSTLILNIFIIAGGLLTDRLGARKTFQMTTVVLMLLAYPLFVLFTYQSLLCLVVSYFVFSIIFGFIPSAYASMLAALFPTETRYSGIALSYNLAYALFGGLSPIICTLAIHYFHSILAPAGYIITIAAMSWLACYLIKPSVMTN